MSELLLVVCPAFNESASIAGVLADLAEAVPYAGVVVVDDGSTDGTADIARAAGARVLELPFNVGVGGALRAGLLLGRREGVHAVVQCDADGQHPAESIPALVAALDRADIAIGSRWSGKGEYGARGPRRWAMSVLGRVLSRVHRVRLNDVTSGFRAFGPRAIDVLSRDLPPEYLGDTIDALMIAKQHRLTVVEVPVAMRARTGGNPSHRPVRATLYLFRSLLILVLAAARLLRRRRVPAP